MEKDERNRFYRMALARYDEGFDDGVCVALAQVSGMLCCDTQIAFKEFADKRPDGIADGEADVTYWWPLTPEGIEYRKEILIACINETNT